MYIIIGKEIFYTTISVPEKTNRTIRLEMSDSKHHLGKNWEKLLHCDSDHVTNIIDNLLNKLTNNKIVQIEVCIVDIEQKACFKEFHETSTENVEIKKEFSEENKIDKSRNQRLPAFEAKIRTLNTVIFLN